MKIFILGPCHQIYIRTAAIPNTKYYQTPIGNIEIDQQIIIFKVIKQLHEAGEFDILDKDADEEEHSIEMHLPFIKHLFSQLKFTLVPLLVGSIGEEKEQYYADILQKYFDDENSLFIISTDFCHWGQKFNFTKYNESDGEIFESIEKLDQSVMEQIENHNPKGFSEIIKKSQNPICGKYPLGILLKLIFNSKLKKNLQTKFIRYAQSFPIKDKMNNCVSFASAVTILNDQDI